MHVAVLSGSSWGPWSSDHAVPASAQALDDNGLASFARTDGACDASGEGPGSSASEDVAVIVSHARKRSGPSAENGRAGGFVVEPALIPRERLAGGQIGSESPGWRAVEDRGVVRAAIATGAEKRGQKTG